MAKYVAPDLQKQAFSCPHCGAYTTFAWKDCYEQIPNHPPYRYVITGLHIANCFNCKERIVWYDGDFHSLLLWPVGADTAPLPHDDMPESMKVDFLEARKMFRLSPRGACALLRSSLRQFCIERGESGEDMTSDVDELVAKGMPTDLQQALRFVRVVGDNAVTPGVLCSDDMVETASSLFQIINLLIDCLITQPKRIHAMYQDLPQG